MLKLVKLPNHKKKILTAYCEHMIIEKLQRKNDENYVVLLNGFLIM